MSYPAHSMDSLAVHAGRGDLRALGVHAAPIDLSSTNPVPGLDAGALSYEPWPPEVTR